MRFRSLAVLASAIFFAPSLYAGDPAGSAEYLTPWKTGYFDIYSIATGLGENSFLIFPDGTSMLIDCGDMTGSKWNGVAVPDASKAPAAWVAEFIKHFSGKSGIDFFLLSHLHEDHLGYVAKSIKPGEKYGHCGVTELVDYIKVGKWIDRAWPNYDFPKAKLEKNSTVRAYSKFVSEMDKSGRTKMEKIELGSRRQIGSRRPVEGFEVWTIAASGSIDGEKAPLRMITEDNCNNFDENCYSIAQLFTYGKFSYYSGGDLPSGNWNSYFGKLDRDFESRVAERIGHPVTVTKMSHHGCPDSCNSHFLWILRPQAFVVSCSNAKHPFHDTVERVMDAHNPCGKLIFPTQYTCRETIGADTFSKLQPAGHIVVRVYEGGNSYQIFVLDSESKDYRIIHKTKVFTL